MRVDKFNLSVKLIQIMIVALCAFLAGCGGGGGGDSLASHLSVTGRWVGTVTLDPDQGCGVQDNLAGLSGKGFTLDISQSSSDNRPVIVDQDGALYQADGVAVDNSFDAPARNQDFNVARPTGPTAIEFLPNDGVTSDVKVFVTYDRFCTVVFSGTFARTGDAPANSPGYADVTGTWKGDLPLAVDECNVGVNPLRESHQVSFDNIDVSLVSTDNRLLNGTWKTVSSFSVETSVQTPTFPIIDTVEYSNISSGAASVTVTHMDGTAGTNGDAFCTTIWQGQMQRTAR